MTSQVMNGNGKAFHDSDVGKPPEPNFAMTTLQTVLDFILFISVSIGYILQVGNYENIWESFFRYKHFDCSLFALSFW